MKQYHYFVSYAHTYGFGMCEVYLDKKIQTYDDIKEIPKIVSAKFNNLSPNEIVIINYKFLREEN